MSLITKFFGRKIAEAAPTSDEGLSASHQAIELARQGRISVKEMLDRLASANLFLPLAEPPLMDGQRVKSWKPATVSKTDGSQWVVAFSSADLTVAFSKQNPVYSHGLSVKTKWILQLLPEAHGLVVNIGSANMFEWSAEGLLRYKADVLAEGGSCG
jgi:hypothetical protein